MRIPRDEEWKRFNNALATRSVGKFVDAYNRYRLQRPHRPDISAPDPGMNEVVAQMIEHECASGCLLPSWSSPYLAQG